MRKTIVGTQALAAILLPIDAGAETTRGGWYGGLDLGMATPRDMDTKFTSTDGPTNCDQHFSSVTIGGDTLPLRFDDPRCERGRGSLDNSFDLDSGPLLGLSAGYTWRGLRFEAEYFYRQHGGEHNGNTIEGDGKQQEFVQIGERVSDVKGHQFFGNVYYDFLGVSPKLIPYIGGGVGVLLARMNYSIEGHRNPDREAMIALGRHPAAAGTLSSDEEKLTDTIWGYQLIVGLDYPLTEKVLLGMKARYVEFVNDFKDDSAFDRLRSHTSTVGPGGDEVRYRVKTDDWGFWGASLNLKYFF